MKPTSFKDLDFLATVDSGSLLVANTVENLTYAMMVYAFLQLLVLIGILVTLEKMKPKCK